MTWKSPEAHREWSAKNASRVNAARRAKYSASHAYRSEKIKRAKKYRVRNQEIVRAFKLSQGCQRCGFKAHHVALDLHHRDRKAKEFKIASTTCSLERLQAEMAKCEVLCSNCHKIAHFEAGWLKGNP